MFFRANNKSFERNTLAETKNSELELDFEDLSSSHNNPQDLIVTAKMNRAQGFFFRCIEQQNFF